MSKSPEPPSKEALALGALIERARAERGWTWKVVTERARKSKRRGLSQRNLNDYLQAKNLVSPSAPFVRSRNFSKKSRSVEFSVRLCVP